MLPFMVLEWTTATAAPRSRFALPLFVCLWLIAALFIRTAHAVMTKSVWLAPLVAFLGALGSTWFSWMVDQMPCFRGATGC